MLDLNAKPAVDNPISIPFSAVAMWLCRDHTSIPFKKAPESVLLMTISPIRQNVSGPSKLRLHVGASLAGILKLSERDVRKKT